METGDKRSQDQKSEKVPEGEENLQNDGKNCLFLRDGKTFLDVEKTC